MDKNIIHFSLAEYAQKNVLADDMLNYSFYFL